MLLDIIRKHLFNHNEPGQEPVFGEAGEVSNYMEIPEYEYIPNLKMMLSMTHLQNFLMMMMMMMMMKVKIFDAPPPPPSSSYQEDGLTVHPPRCFT